jgi:hypothetical protein
MIVLLPILVLVAGFILYMVNTPTPRAGMWAEVGRLMFFAGMLVFLLSGAEQVITFLSR